ncbi:MAG: type I-B CRISPR-associated protein Cas8b1/Cst1 [Dehalococcoidales bacterium]|nr:type I-B CRISPR-associated protein Cas8b1/Cst1 [Dehalococcoidales bacterium]
MLKYTGHPLLDVGAATIAAFARKRDLKLVTKADLESIADEMSHAYVRKPMTSFLTSVFMNSGFVQPAYTQEQREAYASRVLYAWRDAPVSDSQRCLFTGDPAVAVTLSLKDDIPPGRMYRQHMPLTSGVGVINFYPSGDAGLPISGLALLCIHALPLGCAKCGGKLLAVHADDPELMVDFVAEFLEHNLIAIDIARHQGSNKIQEAKATAKTLLIETLLKTDIKRAERGEQSHAASVTAYHFTNLGQAPDIVMYHLPLELTRFLSYVESPDYRREWNALVGRGWRLSKPKRRKRKDGKAQIIGGEDDSTPRENVLYEDLFGLPDNARWFVRRYFLRVPIRTRFEDDPRRAYSPRGEAGLVSWHLTELFLREVMRVENERIEQIRGFGDRVASYVSEQDDKRFFGQLFEKRYDYFRMNLIRANLRAVRSGRQPLIDFDPYIRVFEDGEEVARPDWRLARDLTLVRVIEQLHARGWLGTNLDAIPESKLEELEEAEPSA